MAGDPVVKKKSAKKHGMDNPALRTDLPPSREYTCEQIRNIQLGVANQVVLAGGDENDLREMLDALGVYSTQWQETGNRLLSAPEFSSSSGASSSST